MYYVLLAGVAAVAAVIAFRRTKHKAALAAAYFFSMSVVMLADWIAWGMLRLYEYHPSLSADPKVDAVWGELLGDILFVPGATVALMGFRSLVVTALLGSGLFALIEYFFIRAGLFTLTGWPNWLTPLAFAPYFWGVWRLRAAIFARGLGDPAVRLVLRVSLLVCSIATLTLALRGFDNTVVNLHVMPTFLQNQSLGRFIIYIPILVGSGLWVMVGPRQSRLLAVTLGLGVWNYLLAGTGIQEFHWPWTEPVDALAQGITVGVACLLEQWIFHLKLNEERPTFNR